MANFSQENYNPLGIFEKKFNQTFKKRDNVTTSLGSIPGMECSLQFLLCECDHWICILLICGILCKIQYTNPIKILSQNKKKYSFIRPVLVVMIYKLVYKYWLHLTCWWRFDLISFKNLKLAQFLQWITLHRNIVSL